MKMPSIIYFWNQLIKAVILIPILPYFMRIKFLVFQGGAMWTQKWKKWLLGDLKVIFGEFFFDQTSCIRLLQNLGGQRNWFENFLFKMGQANCHLTSEPLDGFLNFKKEKWSKLNFKCIELLPSNQAATKAAMTAAT